MPTRTEHLPEHLPAVLFLRASHPKLAEFIEIAPPCPFKKKRDYFPALCRAMLAQQVSTAAARTVTARFRALFPQSVPTPSGLLELTAEQLRTCGIGPQKQGYIRALAGAHLDGTLPRAGWHGISDDEVIERLTAVRGIGRWTAEMFLIFVLARPNVWPVDDLGIQYGAQRLLGMKKRPTPKQLRKLGERFDPHRTVASWYLWRMSELGR